jgi:hypothetical protein
VPTAAATGISPATAALFVHDSHIIPLVDADSVPQEIRGVAQQVNQLYTFIQVFKFMRWKIDRANGEWEHIRAHLAANNILCPIYPFSQQQQGTEEQTPMGASKE